MYLEPIFSTPIWSEILNHDTKKIESYIRSIQIEDSGRVVSNEGGWQSNDFYEDDIKDTPIMPVVNNIKKLLRLCFQTLEVPHVPKIDNFWMNINPPGSYNKPHIHGNNCFLSICYYVNAPENCGDLYFDRGPQQEYIISNFVPRGTNTFNSSRWAYKPESNKIIIFPSWLSHHVGINRSEQDRISIAFNIKI